MINIKKFDSVAEAVKTVMQKEALKGQQHKIDKNKNNKIDAHDFAILRGEKKGMKKEEAEQIDELSKSTLGSYVKKASDDAMVSRKLGSDFANKAKRVKSDSAKGANTRLADRFNDMAKKRRAGVGKAVDRLTKEETTSEGLNEMDKSQPSSDRGGESSGDPYAKGGKATPVKSKDVAKDALKTLQKSFKKSTQKEEVVAEGSKQDKDMTGQTCQKCKKDKYQERSQHDDMDGKVTCSCGHRVDRWKKYKEQGVAEGAKWRSNPDAHDKNDDGDIYPKTRDMFAYDPLTRRQSTAGDARTARGKKSALKTSLKMAQGRHGPKSQLPEEQEQVDETNNPFDLKNYKSQLPTKPGEKAGFDSKKISTGTVYSRKPVKDEPMKKEEVELDERTLTKGETSEKERIVKGMKKSLKGFKARYGDKAKNVMYATATKAAKNEETIVEAKRPESDTVPFITNGDNKPLTHAKDLAKKSLKRLKSEMMGKAGTSE